MFQSFINKAENLISSARDPIYREYVKLFLKYESSERNKVQQVDFLNYHLTIPDALSFIYQVKEIFVNQSYKFSSPSGAPVIFDCGANIGISCLYFKRIFPNARVTAFEADPVIAKILSDNLNHNRINDVTIIPKAVWKDNDGVEFGSGFADAGSIYSLANRTKIESIRLRDMIEKEDKIDFLKIDIEGAEIEVLSDCSKSLNNVKNLFVEYHGWKGLPQKLDVILSIISQNKFKYFIDSISNMEQPFSEKEKILSSDIQINIFAVKEY